MHKFSDSDDVSGKQTIGARDTGHSLSKIVKYLRFYCSTVSNVYREDGGKNLAIRKTAKGNWLWTRMWQTTELYCNYPGKQRVKPIGQISTQLNQGASCIVNKWTVQRSPHHMGFESHRLALRILCWMHSIWLFVILRQENTNNRLLYSTGKEWYEVMSLDSANGTLWIRVRLMKSCILRASLANLQVCSLVTVQLWPGAF